MAEDELDQEETQFNVIGSIVIFGFMSIIIVFITALIVSSLNNYAFVELYDMASDFASQGIIPAEFVTTIDNTASGYGDLLNYLDFIWFGAFLSFAASSLVYSYFRKREGYFSMFAFMVLGLIIVTYVGGVFIQFSEWFRDDILFAVFPALESQMPIFSWYLNNMGVINLILLVLVVIVNFVDLDFSRFNQRKKKEADSSEI